MTMKNRAEISRQAQQYLLPEYHKNVIICIQSNTVFGRMHKAIYRHKRQQCAAGKQQARTKNRHFLILTQDYASYTQVSQKLAKSSHKQANLHLSRKHAGYTQVSQKLAKVVVAICETTTHHGTEDGPCSSTKDRQASRAAV